MYDTRRIRSAFERAAPEFDNTDFLHHDIRDRLLSRLEYVRLEPRHILDLGAGTAAASSAIADKFPESVVIAADLAVKMLQTGSKSVESGRLSICADATKMPMVDESIDLIFSNLMLPHCHDLSAVFAEARRLLRFPGLLTFSTFGRDSLIELREAWANADEYSHINDFPDMHNIGDALVQAGFAEPVVDTERVTVTYEDLSRLMADLGNAGSVNATPHRNPGLTGRHTWKRMVDAYEKRRDSDGRLPVTLEIVFGVAWRGSANPSGRMSDGAIEVPIDQLIRRG